MSNAPEIETAGAVMLACDETRTLQMTGENGDVQTVTDGAGKPVAVIVHTPIIRLLVSGCLAGGEESVIVSILAAADFAYATSISELHVVAPPAVAEAIYPPLKKHGFQTVEGILVKVIKARVLN